MNMHWLALPEARSAHSPAFTEQTGASAWIARLPQADPFETLLAVLRQIEALDAADLPGSEKFALLCRLRSLSIHPQRALNARYLRKALPLAREDQRCFELAQRCWRSLAIACIRLARALPPGEALPALHHAAAAIRLAQHVHFQAAAELPPWLDRLPFAVLAHARQAGILREVVSDPDFPHIEASTINGQLTWTFLLRLSDPYALSAAQLSVANRAYSRWRDLAEIVQTDNEAQAGCIDLGRQFAINLPTDIPRLLSFSRVLRKLQARTEALQQGESPQSLKLGPELSTAACLRLLQLLERRLSGHEARTPTEDGKLGLAFGEVLAYELLTGHPLRPPADLDVNSASLAHQRIATFGFDRLANLHTAVRRVDVPVEDWQSLDGIALRSPDKALPRRQSPCLLACHRQGVVRLGILDGLQCAGDDMLSAELRWLPAPILAGVLNARQRHAFFLEAAGNSAILPAALGLRPGVSLLVEGLSRERWLLGEIIERGVDFVRHAVSAQ